MGMAWWREGWWWVARLGRESIQPTPSPSSQSSTRSTNGEGGGELAWEWGGALGGQDLNNSRQTPVTHQFLVRRGGGSWRRLTQGLGTVGPRAEQVLRDDLNPTAMLDFSFPLGARQEPRAMGRPVSCTRHRIGRWEGLPEWKTPSTSLSQVWNTRYGTSILCLDLRQTYGTWHEALSRQASSIVQRRLRLRKRPSLATSLAMDVRTESLGRLWHQDGCQLPSVCLLSSGARQGPGQRGLGRAIGGGGVGFVERQAGSDLGPTSARFTESWASRSQGRKGSEWERNGKTGKGEEEHSRIHFLLR